jgi:hypothetical protein
MMGFVISILSTALSALFFILGALLVTEVIRPFRDLSIDGPIAMTLWGVGMGVAAIALWCRWGVPWLNWLMFGINGLTLLGVTALLLVIGGNNRLF